MPASQCVCDSTPPQTDHTQVCLLLPPQGGGSVLTAISLFVIRITLKTGPNSPGKAVSVVQSLSDRQLCNVFLQLLN